MNVNMEIIEEQLLWYCIDTLKDIQIALEKQSARQLIKQSKSGKEDSLILDVLPEHMLYQYLIERYDKNTVLITEERGEYQFDKISTAEIVVFADPTDRSKHLKAFIEKQLADRDGLLFGDIVRSRTIVPDWHKFVTENGSCQGGVGSTPGAVSISGPCCSLTVVKRGQLLFTLCLNYITREIFIACKAHVGYNDIDKVVPAPASRNFRTWPSLKFDATEAQSYVTYLGKKYEENLVKSDLIDDTFMPLEREPGGPARILYLSDLNSSKPAFILSNGEKIGEWIGWLAFCKFYDGLTAYSIYPGTFFAKDDILMTPSPPYSIIELDPLDSSLRLNFEKLKYLRNPSRYREMILVVHRRNTSIRAMIQAKTKNNRELFIQ